MSIAERDGRKNNLIDRVVFLENRLEELSRWAAPISALALPNPPGIHAWRTTVQSIPNNTITDVTALTDSMVEYGLALESGNIIKLRRDSSVEYYAVGVHAKWSNASTVGDRQLEIGARNADTAVWAYLGLDTRAAVAMDDTQVTVSYIHWLNTSDAIKFRVKQNSGGNLDLELFLVDVVLLKSTDQVGA